MNEWIAKINDALGSVANSALGHALLGLLILIVGLFIVRIIAGILTRLVGRIEFLHTANLTKPIASLIRGVLSIFVLIAVLEHFNLTNVLAPLKNMSDQFLAAVPRIIGAGVWLWWSRCGQGRGRSLGSEDQRFLNSQLTV